ncbi:MAG TPA: hypothetical protein VHY22_17435 [Chthoniobacteraceae bacterium]|jgi:hypothetical protein|nr:hypothetical protein [Chthoniobacteraceae bacterium]
MKKIVAVLFAVMVGLAGAPGLRAAPLRTGIAFALSENAPAGTRYWCAFPGIPASQWTVVLYERQRAGTAWRQRHEYTYRPLAQVSKPARVSGRLTFQTMVAPPHGGRDCVLAAFRNGIQQPYRGWTQDPPFGWHTFGVADPALKVRVVEFSPHARPGDIRNYESVKRRQWTY